MGRLQIGFRGLWADDVGVQLFFRSEDEDVEPLTDFLVDLRDMVLVITRFTPRALDVYFRSLPGGTIRPDPDRCTIGGRVAESSEDVARLRRT